jgi:ABC-type Mn2+/Zn2+ transport system ATPase subunit
VLLARALLQGAGMVVLDGSLAALDPESLQKRLEYVLRRAGTHCL